MSAYKYYYNKNYRSSQVAGCGADKRKRTAPRYGAVPECCCNCIFICLAARSILYILCDNVCNKIGGELFVAEKIKCKASHAARYLTEIHCKAVHLSHGNFCGYFRELVFVRLHSEHSAAALVKFAHNVTCVLVRYCYFKTADRFEHDRLCLFQPLLVCQ